MNLLVNQPEYQKIKSRTLRKVVFFLNPKRHLNHGASRQKIRTQLHLWPKQSQCRLNVVSKFDFGLTFLPFHQYVRQKFDRICEYHHKVLEVNLGPPLLVEHTMRVIARRTLVHKIPSTFLALQKPTKME